MNRSYARLATTNLAEKNIPILANIIVMASLKPPMSPRKSRISVALLTFTVL